jgi:hypothetical protein
MAYIGADTGIVSDLLVGTTITLPYKSWRGTDTGHEQGHSGEEEIELHVGNESLERYVKLRGFPDDMWNIKQLKMDSACFIYLTRVYQVNNFTASTCLLRFSATLLFTH